MNPWQRDFSSELTFSFSRSSGPGGQNVNKVSSKAELAFDVERSELLSTEEKDILRANLYNLINNEGVLKLSSQESRSQPQNKEIAVEKFYQLIKKAFYVPKKRKATKPTFASKVKRAEGKRLKSTVKKMRGKSGFSED